MKMLTFDGIAKNERFFKNRKSDIKAIINTTNNLVNFNLI